VPEFLKHLDALGGQDTYPHYAAGWAVAATLRPPGRSRSRRTTAARATSTS
jgi:hypothetical protein